MTERTEALVADDEEEVRRQVVQAVHEVFPELNVTETDGLYPALDAIRTKVTGLLFVISDGKMGDVRAGEEVTLAAVEAGIPNVAYYSSMAEGMKTKLGARGIACITKTAFPQDEPVELKQWLQSIKTI